MTNEPGDVRLSAMRAFLGRITGNIRLISCTKQDLLITLKVVTYVEADMALVEMVSEAAAEIIADFPEHKISEHITVHHQPLPDENLISSGWVFRRSEG